MRDLSSHISVYDKNMSEVAEHKFLIVDISGIF